MSNDPPKDPSTMPPDYEYGNLKLKYLPPPPDLGEGQVYVTKREFSNKFKDRLKGYFRENPLVPISFAAMFVSFITGVTFQIKGRGDLANRMMYVLGGTQIACVASWMNAERKLEAKKQKELEQQESVFGTE